MAEEKLRFLLDENMPVELANQLNERGIDTVTVRSLERLGENDPTLLTLATADGRVLCTHDQGYVEMAKSGLEHAGIIIVPGKYENIGLMVKYFRLLHGVYAVEEMLNRVEYLFD
ncbi:MAG: hypothetical protein F4X87_09530 [Chloroflexi bacterium]|nr:DUF5615 family PIN-like protein [Chloroflexota bacterium]MYE27429.1 hypothetical protein [Chloroflexota bacterium]